MYISTQSYLNYHTTTMQHPFSWYEYLDNFRMIVNVQTGFFNATRLCKDHGRNLKDWNRSDISHMAVEPLASTQWKCREPPSIRFTDAEWQRISDDETVIRSTNDDDTSGTYLDGQLMFALCMWLKSSMYLTANKIIENHLNANKQCFTVLCKNDDSSKYPYRILSTNKSNYDRTIKRTRQQFKNMETVLHLPFHNKNKLLLKEVKGSLQKYVQFNKHNDFMSFTDEEQLCECITSLYDKL